MCPECNSAPALPEVWVMIGGLRWSRHAVTSFAAQAAHGPSAVPYNATCWTYSGSPCRRLKTSPKMATESTRTGRRDSEHRPAP